MAKKPTQQETAEAPQTPREYTDKDKSRARQWFRKADDLRQRRDYDYAIECYITGLEFWPDAVEDAHKPLRSLALQRQQSGGRKPGTMEKLKKSTSGKDPLKAMLNAEYLLAKDPTNATYLDALLKNAALLDLGDTLKWIAPLVFESLRKDKKPNMARFKTFRQVLVEAGERAENRGDEPFAAWCYEQAVNSLDYLVVRNPSDMALKDEQRDLAGRLTIARGKYEDADSFRDSLRDADKQKLLHDGERAKQGEQTLEALIAARKAEYEANPTVPGKINAYVDALLKPERTKEENLAIELLMKAYRESDNYSFKVRADDIRLRQLHRRTRRLLKQAQTTGSESDKQQYRLAAMEQRQTELDIYRERVQKYPTDLRMKYKLGSALFRAGEYDEAIPLLQEAQADPRSRTRAQIMIGRAFHEKGEYAEAIAVLEEAYANHDAPQDELGREMLYWIGRSQEAAGDVEKAREAYGKLLRLDYNYAKGEARKRYEALKNAV